MKGIFKRISAGTTGKAGEKARKEERKVPTRRRYLVKL